MWNEPETLACPFFRLASDHEARAITLGRDRYCAAGAKRAPDIPWQAQYCLGDHQTCPLFLRLQAQRQGKHPTGRLDRLAESSPAAMVTLGQRGSQGQGQPAPLGPVPQRGEKGARLGQWWARLPSWLHRPASAIVIAVCATLGLWVGIALAGGIPGVLVRPGGENANSTGRTIQAYTLTTDRVTPTPTPIPPAPAQPSHLTLSTRTPVVVVQQAAPTAPHPTPTATPTPASLQNPPAVAAASIPVVTSAPVVVQPTTAIPATSSQPPSAPAAATATPAPTVAPTPTVVPTPTPQPTPTPLPTPTPSPTPDPWTQLPSLVQVGQPVAAAAVTPLVQGMHAASVSGANLVGPYRPAQDGLFPGGPSTGGVLFGQGSGYNSVTMTIQPNTPPRHLVIEIAGMTGSGGPTPVLRLAVNGLTIWEGISPFPTGSWQTIAWVITDPSILISPATRVTLTALSPGTVGTPPWVAINTITVFSN